MAESYTYTYATRKRKKNTEGVNRSWDLTVEAVGKDRDQNPYLVANEWIGACIGTFLRLPIPPFSVVQGRQIQDVRLTQL